MFFIDKVFHIKGVLFKLDKLFSCCKIAADVCSYICVNIGILLYYMYTPKFLGGSFFPVELFNDLSVPHLCGLFKILYNFLV